MWVRKGIRWINRLYNCVCVRKPPQHTTHTNIFVFNVVCNHLGVVVNVHCTFIVCVQETTQKTRCSCLKTKEGTIRRVPLLNVLYVKYQTRTAPVMHVHVLPFARTEKRTNHVFLGTLLREYNYVH